MNDIYLDNAATTVMDDEVFAEMEPFLRECYGNPSAGYSLASKSVRAINIAREKVAGLIGARPDEIYFTSGGTESDNTAIFGLYELAKSRRTAPKFLTSATEHPAVLKCAEKLAKSGCATVYADVDETGTVCEAGIEKKTDGVTFASIMMANNEIGTINNIQHITEILRAHDILVHTDAVQAVGHIPIDVHELDVDALSASAHKFHGPKGVGFLYVKNGISMNPFILGGGQEHGLRSGTENVAGIVGLGKAAQIAAEDLINNITDITEKRDILIRRILNEIEGVHLNGPEPGRNRLCNNAAFSFTGLSGSSLVIQLDMKGIASSTGSACSSSKEGASHVLRAINVPQEYIDGSLRLTLSKYTTLEEIDYTVNAVKKSVDLLRSMTV